MSRGRRVGFDTARSETPSGLTPATQLEFFSQPQLVLYRYSFSSSLISRVL